MLLLVRPLGDYLVWPGVALPDLIVWGCSVWCVWALDLGGSGHEGLLLYLFGGHVSDAVVEIGDQVVYGIPGLGLYPSAEKVGEQVQSGIYAVCGFYLPAYGGGEAFHYYCGNLL